MSNRKHSGVLVCPSFHTFKLNVAVLFLSKKHCLCRRQDALRKRQTRDKVDLNSEDDEEAKEVVEQYLSAERIAQLREIARRISRL